MVYRDEQSGELSGLSRVLSITQDDAHVFCRESQLEEEINNIWNLIETFYGTFGFTKITPRFSSRDDDTKFKGNSELWDKAEKVIHDLLEKRASGVWMPGIGEAAFYGPKIDFMAEDALGRKHQVGTIQLDYVQPTNFGLEYVSEEGTREMPVMIHCAIAGSLERFLSVYIEHSAGNFPLWLSPVQVTIIPIAEMHVEYAERLQKTLLGADVRSELSFGKDGFGKRVRAAKDSKVPYFIVIGDKDVEAAGATLESRDTGPVGQFAFDQILEKLSTEIKNKMA
jgi:threonyl-tRNA synthetase